MKIIEAKKEVFFWAKNPTTQVLFRLFNITLWTSSVNKKIGWFVIFGYNVTWRNKNR
jgi:hypothetical protein